MGIKILIILLSGLVTASGAGDQDGFLYWFTSNTQEYQDHPIHFDTPLPPWIHGTLVHNGPGQFEMGDQCFGHAFDGYAKIASWKFNGNKNTILFTTKFLRSKYYEASVKEKKIAPYLTFGPVNPPRSFIEKMECIENNMDNMNVNIYNYSGSSDTISVLNDLWKLYQVKLDTLDTMGSVVPVIPRLESEVPDRQYVPSSYNFEKISEHISEDWQLDEYKEIDHLQLNENIELDKSYVETFQQPRPKLTKTSADASFGRMSKISSAHPVPEYGKDSHLTFLTSLSILPGVKSMISLIRIKSVDVREVVAEVEVDEVPYMHGFAVTKNYAVLFGAPYFISMANLMKYGYVIDAMKWDSTKKAKIFVIHLPTGNTVTMETEPRVIFHFANAFEEGDKIVFDAPVFEGQGGFEEMRFKQLRNATIRRSKWANVTLSRYIIDLKTRSIKISTYCDKDHGHYALSRLTFPTINENYRFHKNCFIYGVNFNIDGKDFANAALVKLDACRRGRDKVIYIPNHYPSEAWFVPAPGPLSKEEDDGYLMTVILDGETKTSYLALINAKTFKITHKAYLPTHIPFATHGRFFPK